MDDAARVGAVLEQHGVFTLELQRDLVALLLEVREEAGVVSPASPGAFQSRVEKRVRDMMVRVAPPGTLYTPALASRVQTEVTAILHDELVARGMTPLQAASLATILSASMRVIEKKP